MWQWDCYICFKRKTLALQRHRAVLTLMLLFAFTAPSLKEGWRGQLAKSLIGSPAFHLVTIQQVLLAKGDLVAMLIYISLCYVNRGASCTMVIRDEEFSHCSQTAWWTRRKVRCLMNKWPFWYQPMEWSGIEQAVGGMWHSSNWRTCTESVLYIACFAFLLWWSRLGTFCFSGSSAFVLFSSYTLDN